MDILRIKSDFMNSLLSKLITKSIRKQTDYDVNLSQNGIDIHVVNDSITFHADVSGNMSKEDFMRLISGKI